jgi:hypothetical protein
MFARLTRTVNDMRTMANRQRRYGQILLMIG